VKCPNRRQPRGWLEQKTLRSLRNPACNTRRHSAIQLAAQMHATGKIRTISWSSIVFCVLKSLCNGRASNFPPRIEGCCPHLFLEGSKFGIQYRRLNGQLKTTRLSARPIAMSSGKRKRREESTGALTGIHPLVKRGKETPATAVKAKEAGQKHRHSMNRNMDAADDDPTSCQLCTRPFSAGAGGAGQHGEEDRKSTMPLVRCAPSSRHCCSRDT
jgi:hypothetical protein